MAHEPTFDQDAFFVEGLVQSANTQETAESFETGDYVFSNNSNFLPSDSPFGSNRRYKLRRNNHLALARENSLYNLLQPSEKEKDEKVKVITYFPIDYIPDPNLTIDKTKLITMRALQTHKQQAHSRENRVSLTSRSIHLKTLAIYSMTLKAPFTRPQY